MPTMLPHPPRATAAIPTAPRAQAPADDDALYAALRARDARFDGRFFFAVTSTGIYCRPVCRARLPRRENCRFFASAAGAEQAGFRPCLRCRPELAPALAPLDTASRLVQRAAALVERQAGAPLRVGALAAALGVSDRHLRRAFERELGVSPVGYAQTQRLLLAKRLLADTTLPITEVALAAGFGSLRRFNAVFLERYRMSPSSLRGTGREGCDAPLRFSLAYRPPLDWPWMLRFLERRAIAGVEHVDHAAGVYWRVLRIGHAGRERVGWIRVGLHAGPCADALALDVDPRLLPAIVAVLARVRRAFDLGCQPDEVAAALGELARPRPGLRLPQAFDGFEIAVRAVLGQQISVRAAHTIAGRVALAFGEPVAGPVAELARAFPPAARIAALEPQALAALGMPAQRARTIVRLAQALAEGRLALDADADLVRTSAVLRAIPGIGDWTVEYLAMRALGWPDAFPAADVGVRKALGVLEPRAAAEAAQRWRPWRAYAVMHLWSSLDPAAGAAPALAA